MIFTEIESKDFEKEWILKLSNDSDANCYLTLHRIPPPWAPRVMCYFWTPHCLSQAPLILLVLGLCNPMFQNCYQLVLNLPWICFSIYHTWLIVFILLPLAYFSQCDSPLFHWVFFYGCRESLLDKYHNFFLIYPSVVWHLTCILILVTALSASVNIGMSITFQITIFMF